MLKLKFKVLFSAFLAPVFFVHHAYAENAGSNKFYELSSELDYKLKEHWVVASKMTRNKPTKELSVREHGLSSTYSVNDNFSVSFDYINAVCKDAQSIRSKKNYRDHKTSTLVVNL